MTRQDEILAEHGIDLFGLFDELVERTGMTRYRIAKETGISQTALSRYASRELRPTIEALCAIASVGSVRIAIELHKTASESRRK